MNIHDATEIAYKNGYEQGKKDMRDSIKDFLAENFAYCKVCTHSDTIGCSDGMVWCNRIRTYMKEDGFCSFGERGSNANEK